MLVPGQCVQNRETPGRGPGRGGFGARGKAVTMSRACDTAIAAEVQHRRRVVVDVILLLMRRKAALTTAALRTTNLRATARLLSAGGRAWALLTASGVRVTQGCGNTRPSGRTRGRLDALFEGVGEDDSVSLLERNLT